MSSVVCRITLFLVLLSTLALPFGGPDPVLGADHTDAPALTAAKRDDARLTDAHGFLRGGRLVLAECLNPTTPSDITKYVFSPDLIVQFNIDNDSAVSYDNAADLLAYGGTVVRPTQIKEDIVFTVRFNDRGDVQLTTQGLPSGDAQDIRVFTGLRDDPFVTMSWDGKNTAAIVLEMPLNLVIKSQSTLLLWNTSKVPGMEGPFQDLDARATRSQGIAAFNSLHPSQHTTVMGQANPDVMFLDTSKLVRYPNGRELVDDLSSLRATPPRPVDQWRKNDVPFLDVFPYLAPPQPPK